LSVSVVPINLELTGTEGCILQGIMFVTHTHTHTAAGDRGPSTARYSKTRRLKLITRITPKSNCIDFCSFCPNHNRWHFVLTCLVFWKECFVRYKNEMP